MKRILSGFQVGWKTLEACDLLGCHFKSKDLIASPSQLEMSMLQEGNSREKWRVRIPYVIIGSQTLSFCKAHSQKWWNTLRFLTLPLSRAQVRKLTSDLVDKVTSVFLSVSFQHWKDAYQISACWIFCLPHDQKTMTEALRELAANVAKTAADKRFPRSKGRWSKEREIRPINEWVGIPRRSE